VAKRIGLNNGQTFFFFFNQICIDEASLILYFVCIVVLVVRQKGQVLLEALPFPSPWMATAMLYFMQFGLSTRATSANILICTKYNGLKWQNIL